MKALFVFHTQKVSGAEIVIKRAMGELLSLGVELYVCAAHGEVSKFFEDVVVNQLELNSVYPPSASGAEKVVKFVQNHRINLLWANSPKAAPLVTVVSRLTRRPAIWAVHDIMKQSLKNGLFVKVMSKGFVKLIAVSFATKRRLVELGAPDEKVVVAKPGIDVASWRAQANGGSLSEIVHPAVVMVGALTPWKGQHVFLEAAKIVLDRGFATNFYIIGDILDDKDLSYKTEILKKLSTPPLKGSVHYLGKRSDIASIIYSSDIAVHASCKPDPFPTVVVESLVLGKAVVASRIGGVPEQIVDGETGLLFEPNDPYDLAVKISRLLSSRELLESIGKRAYESANNFDLKNFARVLFAVMSNAIARYRRREGALQEVNI